MFRTGCFWVQRLVSVFLFLCVINLFLINDFRKTVVVQELEEVGGLEELEKEINRRIKSTAKKSINGS